MDCKLYKIPDPYHRYDKSQPCPKSISELLLNFKDAKRSNERIRKLVTVPAENETGVSVAACQTFFRKLGNAAYVFLPETERIYQFCEGVIPIYDPAKRFLKSGLKGLILGAEETGIVEKSFGNPHEGRDEYEEELLKLSIQEVSTNDWYHFTGTAEIILGELRKRTTPLTPRRK